MTVHDWTRVDDATFHDFHLRWIAHLTDALNTGVLPDAYFARAEQHYGRKNADVLTLHEIVPGVHSGGGVAPPAPPPPGSVAVADAPPTVRVSRTLQLSKRALRRTIAIRRSKTDEVVAVIELVSPANKDRPESVTEFVRKVTGTLAAGVHVVVIDLLPPNKHCPGGLHVAVCDDFGIPRGGDGEGDPQPADAPVSLLSYESRGPVVSAYLEYLKVGDAVPDMPLFLTRGHYVNLPLGATYATTFRALPRVTRDALAPPAP